MTPINSSKNKGLSGGLYVDPERLQQAYVAIRTTPPTEADLEISAKLLKYMSEHYPTESERNINRRTRILSDLRKLFRTWVKDVCLAQGINTEMAEEAGGQIFVSGSYRLGVNEPGADIDTICIAPKHITRKDFFTTLRDRMLALPAVTNLVCIEEAVVPIMTFDYDEINIDLQIAILPMNTIPEGLNILADSVLQGVDFGSEKSLNGPRVTELMIKLTPNRESFIEVLRVVRRWAKRRGLYSNKLGYLGGINYCILTCFVNQLYPTAAPATLLLRFFMVLANWKWPLPIQLCKNVDASLGLEVWNAQSGRNRYHTMPILTPAYPSMNSSVNVSPHTLLVMNEEFKRALKIIQDITASGGDNWDELFEVSDFFAVHQHYLAVDIYANTEEDQMAWCGYSESRMRRLVDSLAYLPQLRRIRVFAKKFPMSFVTEEGKFGVSFYAAFDVDKNKLHGTDKQVRIDSSVEYFRHNELYRWVNRKEGMDVKFTPCQWKNLPEVVFEELGGREKAREIRKAYQKKKKEELEAAVQAAAAIATGIKKRPLEEESVDEVGDETEDGVPSSSSSKVQKLEVKTEDIKLEGESNSSSPKESVIDNEEKPEIKQEKETTEEPVEPKAVAPPVVPPVVKKVKELTGKAPSAVRPKKAAKMKISFGKK